MARPTKRPFAIEENFAFAVGAGDEERAGERSANVLERLGKLADARMQDLPLDQTGNDWRLLQPAARFVRMHPHCVVNAPFIPNIRLRPGFIVGKAWRGQRHGGREEAVARDRNQAALEKTSAQLPAPRAVWVLRTESWSLRMAEMT